MYILLEVMIILTTVGSWLFMFLDGKGSLFSRRGRESLKYYTTLSNLFAGLAAVPVLIYMIINGEGTEMPYWLGILKCTSAVSVGLTFLVVLVYLAPKAGFGPMFKGELFCLHAAGPILAVASYLLNPAIPKMQFYVSFIAVIPTLLYGIGYAANILKNGRGDDEHTNDWYGFAIKGIRTIPFVFLFIIAATWVMACVLVLLRS